MNAQRIGYIRVSSLNQNTDRQLDGIQLDRTFTDKIRSGKTLWYQQGKRLPILGNLISLER